MIRALDWLNDGPGSSTRMLLAAWGRPPVRSGPLQDRMLERIRLVTEWANMRGLAFRGYMSTGDRWPCSTDMFGKTPGATFRWLNPAE